MLLLAFVAVIRGAEKDEEWLALDVDRAVLEKACAKGLVARHWLETAVVADGVCVVAVTKEVRVPLTLRIHRVVPHHDLGHLGLSL